ncbi:MAG TPA: permease-like cell division protein FtsX [Actinomycetota bacterium]|nr:permease-like cell division protein FtsX [Actinomycetota bacterium]
MKLRFVLSETFQGLRRNLTMTFAVIITVAVTLTLFGAGLLVRAQVDSMKDYWYDRVEVSIFLCGASSPEPSCSLGAITPEVRTQIETELNALRPLVQDIYYESKEEAYQHFLEQFRDSPITQNVTADALPESFRVKLSDPTKYEVIAAAFAGRPGVEQVQDQRQLLDRFFKLLNGLQVIALSVAAAMLAVTALLVINTIRVAAHARRREVGIMRLVGASNFMIRMPFLLEAAVSAAVGGLLAVGAIVAGKVFLIDKVLAPSYRFTAFVSWEQVLLILPIVFLTGIVIAMVAAALTLRRYLKV